MADRERQEKIRQKALADLEDLHHHGYLGRGTPPRFAAEEQGDSPPSEMDRLDAGWLGLALRLALGAAVMAFLVWLLLQRLLA